MTGQDERQKTLNFSKVSFLLSAHDARHLPAPSLPDIAFAGRSNVGKSSLINCLVNRNNLVKTSSRPGKTQSLNYFLLDDALYLVDLPGYGFAKVSQQTRQSWRELIDSYVPNRDSLALVVVVMDLRHELKSLDRELINWLRHHQKAYLPVYTKADKLTRGRQARHAAILDAGLGIHPHERLIFSARTSQGLAELRQRLTACARAAIPEVSAMTEAPSSLNQPESA